MTTDRDKAIAAIANLMSRTQQGLVEWSSLHAKDLPPPTEDYIPITGFEALVSGKNLRLLSYKYRIQEPDPFAKNALLHLLAANKKFPYWENSVSLEIVDLEGQPLWRFPYSSVLPDLLKIVSFKCSGAEDLIDELTKENGKVGE